MSRENDHLTPTPFEPAPSRESPATAPGSRRGHPGRDGPRWVVPALLGLTLVALAVLFLLPQPEPDPSEPAVARENGAEETNSASDTAPRSAKPAPPEATPWSDALQARLRKEAQDVLAELLELQYQLEERGVEQWAGEDFEAAKAGAAAGDELYRQREYVPAREHYEAALTALQGIEESIPERTAQQLEQARQAIEAGDPDTVTSSLERAALMSPDDPDLATLRARADKLPDVMAALAKAAQAEAAGDLAAAVAALEQATGLDGEHQRAADELARVSARYTDQRFNRAMSEGYAALDEGRFSDARKSFKQARSLRPDAREADSALQELQATETAHRLATLKRKGTSLEEQGDWQAAVDNYESALKIDPSVVFAQEGLQRARPRARLQGELEKVIYKPERLSDPSVARAAAALLEEARQLDPAGPVVREQVEKIDRLLAVANQPVTVTLRSDQHTSVTVYKVAKLGQFSERELALRPGTYTAVGTRTGYRDVRRDFTVSPDQPLAPVVIACTEPI